MNKVIHNSYKIHNKSYIIGGKSKLNLGLLPSGTSGKESTRQCRRYRFDPWVRKIPCRRKWQPTPVFCLENSMDRGAWWATVPGVGKSQTRLRDITFTFHIHVLEKEMATHSSVLAWRIPGAVEPGGLPSKGSHRVGHNCSDLAAAAARVFQKNTSTLVCLE